MQFANTDSIVIAVDGRNRVQAMRFVYDATTKFETVVADYETTLGKAYQTRDSTAARGTRSRATWTDGRTHLEVIRTQRHTTTELQSLLRNVLPADRAGAL